MQNHTNDYLLNKRIKIIQPINGYRASTDAVLLSSMIHKVKKSDTILDVGSGTGAISLCLAERFPQTPITGLEIQKTLTDLSNQSAQINNFDNLKFINVDIKTEAKQIPSVSYTHIITNPPYSEKDMESPNKSKALAHNFENFSLKNWINFCIKKLHPQGYFYTINRAEAITEILSIINGKLGEIKILPLHSKPDQPAKRVIIIARKDSHAPTQILPPFITHNNDGSYTAKAHEILRDGKSYFEK